MNSYSSSAFLGSKSCITIRSLPNIHGRSFRSLFFPDSYRKVNTKTLSPISLHLSPAAADTIDDPRLWSSYRDRAASPTSAYRVSLRILPAPPIRSPLFSATDSIKFFISPSTFSIPRAPSHPSVGLHVRD